MSTACRTCGAAVRWVVNEKTGKRMPLDPEPLVTTGTRFTMSGWNDPDSGSPVVRTATGEEGGLPSHFATCPDAQQHRRAR